MTPSPTVKWLATLLIPAIVAAGSAYAAVRVDLSQLEAKTVAAEEHADDEQVHISIESAVSLERRLGTLEGEISRLNDNLEHLHEDK